MSLFRLLLVLFFNPLGRDETYDEARTRLRVTNDEIEQARRMQVLSFYCVLAVLVIAWVFATPKTLFQLPPMLSFSLICLALMFVQSFRASQIKAKNLHAIKVWLRNPRLWFPWF